jgi:hypothetical protein
LPYKQYAYEKANSIDFKDSVDLREENMISFPTDSVMPLSTHSLEIFTDSALRRYFTMLNEYNGSIYVYDYDTRKFLRKILLYYKGKDSVGNPEYYSYHFLNFDSIVICNKWFGRVYLVNPAGHVLGMYQFGMPLNGLQVTGPDPSAERPMFVVGRQLYLPGRLFDLNTKDHTRLMTALTVDLESKSQHRFLPRPAFYNTGTWSPNQFELYQTYDNLRHLITYSFAADPYVIQTDLQGKILSRHYLGSKYFDTIKPFLPEMLPENQIDLDTLEEYDYISPSFNKIIFDPYRNVYYRTTRLALTKDQYVNANQRFFPKETIIICDTAFRKIGETMLPDRTYNTQMIFVTSEGLHIAKLPEKQPAEDKLEFSIFKLVKK